MSLSGQRALNIYEIAELVLRHAAHGRPLNKLLLLQRTCSTWHSIIRRWLVLGKAPLDTPVRNAYCIDRPDETVQALKINLTELIWIYDPKLHEIKGVVSRQAMTDPCGYHNRRRFNAGVRKQALPNLYCDGAATCLDLHLRAHGIKIAVLLDTPTELGVTRLREGCDTVRDVLDAAVVQFQQFDRMSDGWTQGLAAVSFIVVYALFDQKQEFAVKVYLHLSGKEGFYQQGDGKWVRVATDW